MEKAWEDTLNFQVDIRVKDITSAACANSLSCRNNEASNVLPPAQVLLRPSVESSAQVRAMLTWRLQLVELGGVGLKVASGRPVLFSSNRSQIPNAFIRCCALAFRTSSILAAMNAGSSWGRARLGGFARLARIASVLGTKDSLHLSYAHCRTLGPKGVLNGATP